MQWRSLLNQLIILVISPYRLTINGKQFIAEHMLNTTWADYIHRRNSVSRTHGNLNLDKTTLSLRRYTMHEKSNVPDVVILICQKPTQNIDS